MTRDRLREMLTSGDRRSIARADDVVAKALAKPELIADLASLTMDEEDWLVSSRALDALEKIAHVDPELVRPHRRVFLDCAASDKWEMQLQIVRAIPLLRWTARERSRAKAILLRNLDHPKLFVRAWALDSLATWSVDDPSLRRVVAAQLVRFESSESRALQARARHIRARLR